MSNEIHSPGADEQASVGKRDPLNDPIRVDVRHIAAAIEEDTDIERVRETYESLSIRMERVLLDCMPGDPRQYAVVDEVDLGATEDRINVDLKRTHFVCVYDAARGERKRMTCRLIGKGRQREHRRSHYNYDWDRKASH